MKNLIRIFLILVIVGACISIGSSCSDENDCSLAGRPMMYCTLYTLDEITDDRVKDTLDSLTITALGTVDHSQQREKCAYPDVAVAIYQ